MITVLAGGTGSIKIIRGLSKYTSNLSIISNIGDNFWFDELYICPDIDTCMYGLADILDKSRGWGIKNDSFYYLNTLKAVGEESWFQIGDRDLVTHLIRTKLLSKGFSLAKITEWLARHHYNIQNKILPASNLPIETRILTEKGDMNIQEFWVKNKAKPKVLDIYYKNIEQVQYSTDTVRLLRASDIIILAPANPISSIGPIISIAPIKKELRKQRDKVIAISPIIGKNAISGPANKYLKAKNIESSCLGVAKYYSKVISKMVIDHKDTNFSNEINKLGISTFDTNILMTSLREEKRLAKFILKVMNLRK